MPYKLSNSYDGKTLTPPYTDGGWKQNVAGMEFAVAGAHGWPGWERNPATNKIYTATLRHISGKHRRSRDLAVAWDDLAHGRFHWSDQTISSMPWVERGDTYLSHWQFQLRHDFERFCQLYLYPNGGYAPDLPPPVKDQTTNQQDEEDPWDVH
jgi:hypothetical protein